MVYSCRRCRWWLLLFLHHMQFIQLLLQPPPALLSQRYVYLGTVSLYAWVKWLHLTVFMFSGFDLPRHTWSLMNRFRAGQGPCRDDLQRWGLAQSPSCDCGQWQTMDHIVDTCPLTKLEGGLNLLHEVDDDAVIWLESTVTAALVKLIVLIIGLFIAHELNLCELKFSNWSWDTGFPVELFTARELNWTAQVDPVTWRIHWSWRGHARQHHSLIGWSKTRTVGAHSVGILWTLPF